MMKFDLVICNPPYHLGNIVVKNSIGCCKDRLSVIMPLSQYKKGDLFTHITGDEIEVVGDSEFEDASITGNLSICTLSNKPQNNYNKYLDLMLKSFNPKLLWLYQWNYDNDKGYRMESLHGKSLNFLNIELDFIEMTRYISKAKGYGYHTKNEKSIAYRWNMLCEWDEVSEISHLGRIHFETKEGKNNYTKFAYNYKDDNKYECLESQLLCGMNLTETSKEYSVFHISQIDWNTIHLSQKELWDKGKYDEAVLAEIVGKEVYLVDLYR